MDDKTKHKWTNYHEIGHSPWHSKEGNELLAPSLKKLLDGATPTGKSILVPMCGKTADLLWLYNQGFNVVGIELSEIACRDFFKENSLDYGMNEVSSDFKVFVHDDRLKIIQGDIFLVNISLNDGKKFDYVWDCHALSALDYEIHDRYLQHIRTFLADNAKGLVNSFDYGPSAKIERKPCSMDKELMEKLFKNGFTLELLERIPAKDLLYHPKLGFNEDVVVYMYKCV